MQRERTIVNWRSLPPNIVEYIEIQEAKISLIHSKRCKTTMRFVEKSRLTDALLTLTNTQKNRNGYNPKIQGFIKIGEHVEVNDMQLGPLLGEVVSRHLNQCKPRGCIGLTSDVPASLLTPLM